MKLTACSKYSLWSILAQVLEKADEKVRTRRKEVRAEHERLMLEQLVKLDAREKLVKLDTAISATMHEIVADQDLLDTYDAFRRWTNEWLPGIFEC